MKLSPTRRLLLKYLVMHGETSWGQLPKSPAGATIGSLTWRRMITEGLVVQRWVPGVDASRPGGDYYFAATEAGRQAAQS